MWERLGIILIFIVLVLVGLTTMTAYLPISAGVTYYNAFVLAQDTAILQGSAWILVGLGLLLRFHPRPEAGDRSEN